MPPKLVSTVPDLFGPNVASIDPSGLSRPVMKWLFSADDHRLAVRLGGDGGLLEPEHLGLPVRPERRVQRPAVEQRA